MRLSSQIYKDKKHEFIKTMGLTESSYTEMIKGDYDTGAGQCSAKAVVKVLAGESKKLQSKEIDLWDSLWFYKRNFHVVVSLPDEVEINKRGLDTTILSKLDKDLEIDFLMDSEPYYVHAIRRNIPIVINGYECVYTIEVYNSKKECKRFHFASVEKCRKVYMSGCAYAEKGECDGCGKVACTTGDTFFRRSIYKSSCSDSDKWAPMIFLTIVLNVADKYINREKAVRRKSSDESVSNIAVTNAVAIELDTDKERVLSMKEYVYEYRESKKCEYKGGHHASPVSHPRSGYWRKSNRGTHILKDGEFIEVGRGLGKYVYVKETLVNAHKDSVVSDMVQVTDN